MTAEAISVFRPHELFAVAATAPVPEPLGEPVSQVRSAAIDGAGTSRHGVWRCSPGRWRRQVVQAEFCYFLSGEAIFRPDRGDPVHISGGEAAYFPPESRGTWEILRESEKIFIVFDEAVAGR
ncbi:MAG: cupin [Sphingopyxis macrogoltabida]|uniref:Cupin n=1 Tax=Sphingopyxis macrogoltabida TaxID=33050 RepID=A0A2W5L8J4_SPHMC|nr:MAG: cupin [Sphingopyxis macrogoltabida]